MRWLFRRSILPAVNPTYIICVNIKHTILEVDREISLDIDSILELNHSVSHFVIHLLNRSSALSVRIEPGVFPQISTLPRRRSMLF